MTIQYEFKKEDYKYFDYYRYKNLKERKWIKCLYIIIPIIILFTVIALKSGLLNDILYDFLFFMCFIIMIFLPSSVLFYLIEKIVWKISLIISKENKKILFSNKQTIILNDTYIEQNSTDSAIKLDYKNIKSLVINKQYMYIYDNSIIVLMIPFSAFKSEEQRSEFIKIIKEKSNLFVENKNISKKIELNK